MRSDAFAVSGRWSLKYDSCQLCGRSDIKHHSKGYCRSCKERVRAKEGKRSWDLIKEDPVKHAVYKDKMTSRARLRRINDPLQRGKERAGCRKWYDKNKEGRKGYYKKYYNETREYHLTRARERKFSGLYMKAIERDNFTCVRCKKKLELGRFLNVHHKDRDPSNNTMDNLSTVCPKCHQGHFHRDKYQK